MTPAAINIARDLISRWEGMALQQYRDSAGLWTVGVGHLIKSGEDFSDGITEDEALDLLEMDMHEAIQCVDMNVDVDLTDDQSAALVSFCFNLGCSAFHGSTLLKLLNDGKYAAAARQMLRWCRADGKVVKGLQNRRQAEMKLFVGEA